VISISIGFIELLVELQRREARVRRLVDANMIGIIISDIEGQIIEANDAFLHMWDVTVRTSSLGAST